MFRILRLLLIALLACSVTTYSQEKPPLEMRLGPDALPLATVYDCVNVITGEFFLSDTTVATEGPNALLYSHCYDSSSRSKYITHSPHGYGFGMDFPLKLSGLSASGIKDRPYEVFLEEREGSATKYLGVSLGGDAVLATVDEAIYTKHGQTNYAGGGICGADTVKNIKLHFTGLSPRLNTSKCCNLGQCEMSFGSGAHRTYSWLSHDTHYHSSWYLKHESQPNGHQRYFEYDSGNLLTEIRSTNANGDLTFNTLKVDKVDNGFKVTASNGLSTSYVIEAIYCKNKKKGERGPCPFIRQIIPSNGPPVTLTYQYKTSDSEAEYYCKLRKLEKPENHHLYINYHGDGKVSDLQIPYPQGPKRKKRITLARFEYKDTYTDVYDAHGIRTAYARSPEKRIVAIDKFTRHNQYYSTMRYYWCKEGVNLGNLLAKGLFIPVPRNPCLYITVGAYDDRNNLISEDFYGNLSGNNDASFELRADHRPDRPVECFSRIMSYSNDRFNLPVREECSDGKVIAMAYLPETNLLTSKLLGDHQKWYQREFRSYDSNHLLIEMITDDGSGTHQEDLTDVTCRKITTIVPRLTAPAVGFPQTTIESYLDLTTGEQKQLRRIENIYNASELLIRQDLYDANDQFCYTLAFDYDNKRNLIRQTDALGQTTTMAYDENKNKIREKLEGSGFHTLFSYDLMDRLIKRVEKHDDGPCFITEYCYDLVGNRIAQVESYNSIGSEHADGTGTTTHFKYDEFGREIEVQYPPCATLGQGYQPSWVRKEYNVLDQLTAVIDQKGHKTTTSYNVRGQPVCITYPDGTQERCQYHLNGVLAKKWEKEGLCHHYTYDGFSRLIRTDTYDSLGILQYSLEKEYTGAHPTRETDALGYSTTFEYDFAGRKINERKEGTGAFSLSTFAYDSLGRLRTTRQYFGSAEPDYIAQIQEYDFLDRVIETRIEDSSGKILRKETHLFDRLGNRTQTHVYSSENVCSTTQTLYDSHGMPIQQIDALGNITQIAYNYEYRNAHNQKVLQKTTTDPLGNMTVETYDALHRVACVERRNVKGLTTALQEVCYDSVGQKIRQREKVITFGTPSRDYIVSWECTTACSVP